MNIAKMIREKRLERGITQLDLSRKLGYSSPQFVSNWERGLAEPPVKVIRPLSKILGFSEDEFVEMKVREYREFLTTLIKKGARSRAIRA